MATSAAAATKIDQIAELLGSKASDLLSHKAKVSKDQLHLPGSDWVEDRKSVV